MSGTTPRDAFADLLRIVQKLASDWPPQGPIPPLETLHQAYRSFAVSISRQRPLEALTEAPADSASVRFAAALWTIDPGVYEPSILAQAMVKACAEVAREQGNANLDPATRLIAFQLARAVNAPPSLKETDELVVACTLRVLGC